MSIASPTISSPSAQPPQRRRLNPRVYDLLLLVVLGIGAFLRFNGIQWGEFQYLHPDERFLVWVGTDIQPIGTSPEALGPPPNTVSNPWRAGRDYTYPDCASWGGYFDASCSPLNPNNRGHGFYVYGTLPMFLTRYIVEWQYGHSGFNEMTTVGRLLSAAVDMLSVIMIYAIGSRLFDRRVGLLAAAFAAFTVLNIQQSHFFTMDTFASFFTLLALYFAVRVSQLEGETALSAPSPATDPPASPDEPGTPAQPLTRQVSLAGFVRHPFFALSFAFGVALGCAVASKLNAAPVAFVLPVAFILVARRKPEEERPRWLLNAVIYLGIAALVSLLVFRIFQPYAFSGPGFFGLRPNPQWVANIREQRNQAAGDIDFPPSLQWARRPLWFSAQNMLLWGLGIPLGVLAAIGFLWAGWRMLKGEWQQHAVIWLWGAFYFSWQSLQFNPTMRYQMPTYPILAIYAAWVIVQLWEYKKRPEDAETGQAPAAPAAWLRITAIAAGSLVLITTFAWALAFSLVYSRPITRVAASDWIYQNIPGPINLHIQTSQGIYSQPLSLPYGSTIQPGFPYQVSFSSNASGTLSEVHLARVAAVQPAQVAALSLTLSPSPDGAQPLLAEITPVSPTTAGDPASDGYAIQLNTPVPVEANQVYYLRLDLVEGSQVLDACGPVSLAIQAPTERFEQTVAGPEECLISMGQPYILTFTLQAAGQLQSITLSQLLDQSAPSGPHTLSFTIGPTGDDQVVATASFTADLATDAGGGGGGYTLVLDRPVALEKGRIYSLSLSLEQGSGVISIQGTAVANEGAWDDGLPLRLEGYDAFGGIYTAGLNFDMYTDDNAEKRERFLAIYDQAEYIFISSNRQWGSLPRLLERFPMTSLHYRHLLGCPEERTIYWCYSVAQPGMFQGDLGFELVQVFQSDPALGPLRINDQFAEEAFTVYDHPKVLIFRKTAAYDAAHARQVLSQANLNEVVHITPKKAATHLANLKLPSETAALQSSGGTWSELFDPGAWHNRYQVLGVVAWYLALSLLGLLVYPLLRFALPGLPDRGYPLARTAGMLILAYLTWLAGSLGVHVTRPTISMVLLLMVLGSAALVYRQRDDLRQEWQSKKTYFLLIEGLLLGFFLLFLFIRLGNPDLWHPWKGGEKPMDFSYFNAVLKSTTFPPYDPWYAGGSMNYYYWGFVFVGTLVKWLGIVPSFAYNLIIPTLFSLVAMGAFSIAYNLAHPRHAPADSSNPPDEDLSLPPPSSRPYLTGIASALGVAVLGNLGTLRMLFKGWEQLGVPGGLSAEAGFLTRLAALPNGLAEVLFHGAKMPYGIGDWYWIPSRAIPAPGDVEPITEFPMFTFLYGDLHAHMIALPIALLALSWAVAVLLGRARWQGTGATLVGLLLGGLAIGALYPTNLSDIYTYLPIGMAAFGYALYRYADIGHLSWLPLASPRIKRLLLATLGVFLLIALSYLLYLPYRQWYAQAYSTIIPWFGTHTPFWSYLTHWGLFLFIIVSWMTWETRQWMAETPLSSLRKLEKYTGLITFALVLLFLACLLLSIRIPAVETISLLARLPIGRGAGLAWFILPLAAWAGVLILRAGMPDAKRLVLFWVGTALLITMMVEVVVVQGDIGRMNTVFKFYLHSWALFALSSAAALGWLMGPIRTWLAGWRISWVATFVFLVFSASLFTLYGSMAKIKDRWFVNAPHTLDGMAYMPIATYYENYPNVTEDTPVEQRGVTMDLGQDYRLIRWMQDNIPGSPVIVEANSRNLYRWYSRATIYTGLPAVVGWEWHQQQQRASNPGEWVTRRIFDIEQFYLTVDTDTTRQFINLYDVSYVVVGQLEQVTYPGPGLDKFPAFNGILWNEVYRDGDTVLYEVMR